MPPDNLEREQIDLLNNKSWEATQQDPRAALKFAEEAVDLARTVGYPMGSGTGELNAGWAHVYVGNYHQALPRLYAAQEIFEAIRESDGIMKVLNALGVVAFRVGESDRALEYFQQSYSLAKENDDFSRMIAALNNLGELAASIDRYDEATSYFNDAFVLAEQLQDQGVLGTIKVNLARVFNHQHEWQRAEKLVAEGLSLAVASGDRVAEAEALLETATGMMLVAGDDAGKLGETPEELIRRSIDISTDLDNPEGIIAGLSRMGTLYLALGRLDEAQEQLEKALVTGERVHSPLSVIEAYRRLAELHENDGDITSALAVQKKLNEIQNQIANDDSTRRIQTLRAQHELEQAKTEAELFRVRNVELRQKSEELQATVQQLELMNTIGRELTGSLDMDEITTRVHGRLNELMDASVFGIAILHDNKDVLDFALVIERGQRITPFTQSVRGGDSFGAWVVRNRESIWLNDADEGYTKYIKSRKPFTHHNSRSIMFVPLEVEGSVVGVLTVQSFRKRAYTQDHLEMLKLLGSYIGVAIDNSRKHATIQRLNSELTDEKGELEAAYEQIAHMANHDNLTELPNRRLLAALTAEYVPLARRQNQNLAILYLDLDDFKPVNDTYGHKVGDEVLVTIGQRLRGAVRSSDTVGRIGGDEFVIIVREVKESGIETFAAKVLDAVQQPVEIGNDQVTLAASIGVSLFPEHGSTYDALLVAADRAMYEVKQDGKCGVAVAPMLESTPDELD